MSKRHNPGARRIPHSHEEEEDAFLAKILEFTTWAKFNTEALVLAGVILALFVAGGDGRPRIPDRVNFESRDFRRSDFFVRVDVDVSRMIDGNQFDTVEVGGFP